MVDGGFLYNIYKNIERDIINRDRYLTEKISKNIYYRQRRVH